MSSDGDLQGFYLHKPTDSYIYVTKKFMLDGVWHYKGHFLEPVKVSYPNQLRKIGYDDIQDSLKTTDGLFTFNIGDVERLDSEQEKDARKYFEKSLMEITKKNLQGGNNEGN